MRAAAPPRATSRSPPLCPRARRTMTTAAAGARTVLLPGRALSGSRRDAACERVRPHVCRAAQPCSGVPLKHRCSVATHGRDACGCLRKHGAPRVSAAVGSAVCCAPRHGCACMFMWATQMCELWLREQGWLISGGPASWWPQWSSHTAKTPCVCFVLHGSKPPCLGICTHLCTQLWWA